MITLKTILSELQGFLQDFSSFSMIVRLLLSVLFGGLIGMECGKNNFGGGTRTITLVCFGSCMIIILNEYLWLKSGGTIDPTRVAAQIINGVGFLGAGTIMVTGNNRIKGLTTAASLWVSAIIGIAIGSGFFSGAFWGMVFALASIIKFQKYNKWYAKYDRYIDLYLELEPEIGMERLHQYSAENHFVIKSLHRKRNKPLFSDDICVELELDTQGRRSHSSIVTCLKLLEEIHYCEEI